MIIEQYQNENYQDFAPAVELDNEIIGLLPTSGVGPLVNNFNDGEIITQYLGYTPPVQPETLLAEMSGFIETPRVVIIPDGLTQQSTEPVGLLPTATATPSVSEQVGQVIGTVGGTVLGNALNGLLSTLPNAVQSQLGGAGAGIVDNTIKAWWTKNWKAVVGISLGVIVLGTLLVKYIWKPKTTNTKFKKR